MTDQVAPIYHVTPFEWKDGDGPQVMFLVQRLNPTSPDAPDLVREIICKRDEQDFYEFVVDGDRYYDAESEALYLTAGLIAKTDEMLDHVRHLNEMVDANTIVRALWSVQPSRVQ